MARSIAGLLGPARRDLAEAAVQDALVAARQTWPRLAALKPPPRPS